MLDLTPYLGMPAYYDENRVNKWFTPEGYVGVVSGKALPVQLIGAGQTVERKITEYLIAYWTPKCEGLAIDGESILAFHIKDVVDEANAAVLVQHIPGASRRGEWVICPLSSVRDVREWRKFLEDQPIIDEDVLEAHVFEEFKKIAASLVDIPEDLRVENWMEVLWDMVTWEARPLIFSVKNLKPYYLYSKPYRVNDTRYRTLQGCAAHPADDVLVSVCGWEIFEGPMSAFVGNYSTLGQMIPEEDLC